VTGVDNCDYYDPGMQAAYISRLYIMSGVLGINNEVWYDWTGGGIGTGSTQSDQGYSQTFFWMVGSTIGTRTVVGNVNTVTFTLPNGVAAAFIWDTSQYCTNNGTLCTSAIQTVGSSYLTYQTLLGGTTNNPINQTTHQIQVGIQPIMLQAQ
jgi:hypothetical protein